MLNGLWIAAVVVCASYEWTNQIKVYCKTLSDEHLWSNTVCAYLKRQAHTPRFGLKMSEREGLASAIGPRFAQARGAGATVNSFAIVLLHADGRWTTPVDLQRAWFGAS